VSKLGPFLARLHELETDLADEYRKLGERHAADHDVYHQCATFANEAEEHARKLGPVAERYGEDVDDETGPGFWGAALEAVRHRSSELLGGMPPAGMLLLRDLRALFLAAEEVSITWVMAGQAAQAARDQELLQLVGKCHIEVELQVKWLTTRIKVASPQALVVG
jgi:hypothetical protein